MTTALSTRPSTVTQATTEDIVWGVDVAAQLDGAQTASVPGATLTRRGTAVTLADAPTVDGTVIRQRVRGTVLLPGSHRLAVRFTPAGTTNVLESVLTIVCPW